MSNPPKPPSTSTPAPSPSQTDPGTSSSPQTKPPESQAKDGKDAEAGPSDQGQRKSQKSTERARPTGFLRDPKKRTIFLIISGAALVLLVVLVVVAWLIFTTSSCPNHLQFIHDEYLCCTEVDTPEVDICVDQDGLLCKEHSTNMSACTHCPGGACLSRKSWGFIQEAPLEHQVR